MYGTVMATINLSLMGLPFMAALMGKIITSNLYTQVHTNFYLHLLLLPQSSVAESGNIKY